MSEGVPYPIPANSTAFLTIRTLGAHARNVIVMSGLEMDVDADQEANPGLVTYQWADADVASAGEFNFEIKVVLEDGRTIRFPRDEDLPYGTLLIQANLS
jgi:hypothetical protein